MDFYDPDIEEKLKALEEEENKLLEMERDENELMEDEEDEDEGIFIIISVTPLSLYVKHDTAGVDFSKISVMFLATPGPNLKIIFFFLDCGAL